MINDQARLLLILSILALCGTSLWGAAKAQCPRAHCNAANDDFVGVDPPEEIGSRIVDTVWGPYENGIGEDAGSRLGLGCSSNGTIAVCTYASKLFAPLPLENDSVVAYDHGGVPRWSSDDLLTGYTHTSAPIFIDQGRVVVADQNSVIAFNEITGGVEWQDTLDGGLTVSPVQTASGAIVLATKSRIGGAKRGTIYVVDPTKPSGSNVQQALDIAIPAGLTGVDADTQSTPAVFGDRVYVVAEYWDQVWPPVGERTGEAQLIAYDVDITGGTSGSDFITEAWRCDFDVDVEGGNRSSPLLIQTSAGNPIIYLSGVKEISSVLVNHIFAYVDDLSANGTCPSTMLEKALNGPTVASYAGDPRSNQGGFWYLQVNSGFVTHRDQASLDFIERINLSLVIEAIYSHGVNYVATSAITIAGADPERPILIVGARAVDNLAPSYVLAFDLAASLISPIWIVDIDSATTEGFNPTPAQFPIILDNQGGDPRVVFTLIRAGAQAIGLLP